MTGPDAQKVSSSPIFRYVIASKDMRFIEREERQVRMGDHPEHGLLLWGEIPGCGEACHADLSLLLLEHNMSCEGCEDPAKRAGATHAFSEQVGRALAEEVIRRSPDSSPKDRARRALEILLTAIQPGQPVTVVLDRALEVTPCPLCTTARRSGIVRELMAVHQAFYDLCESTLESLGVDLTLERPDFQLQQVHALPVLLGESVG